MAAIGTTRRKFLKTIGLGGAALLHRGRTGLAGQISGRAADDESTHSVREEARDIPVAHECDICVVGGSCTGVFAAIRAARLGAKVAIVERQNCFGGTATNSLVNVWHSLMDTEFKRQIIAGLTQELMQRMKKRGAVKETGRSRSAGFAFNSSEMKIELDEMIREAKVKPFLHTFFCAPYVRDGRLEAVVVQNKSGRSAIKAAMFIDATGDADLCSRLGLATYVRDQLQPPTTCATFSGLNLPAGKLHQLLREHREEFKLPEGFVWGRGVPGSDVYMLAGTRVYGVNCADAEQLTRAEIEGRRQVRAIMDILRKYAPDNRIALQALPSQIGIRETRHVRCRYQLSGDDVLHGKRFADAIANGSYRVDIHHQDKPGITFKYLDGTQVYSRPGHTSASSRWREKTSTNPTFYQIPYRSLVPPRCRNLIVAGRMLDADIEAFSAVRVMVNMNQTGEAAGTACYLALDAGVRIVDVDTQKLRRTLARGGSIII